MGVRGGGGGGGAPAQPEPHSQGAQQGIRSFAQTQAFSPTLFAHPRAINQVLAFYESPSVWRAASNVSFALDPLAHTRGGAHEIDSV